MTLYEFLKAKKNHEIDITDTVFDMAVCYVLPDWEDPDLDDMDKSLIIIAQQLNVDWFDDSYACVDLTDWCSKNRKILDKLLNEHNNEAHRPASYPEQISPDEELFYDVYVSSIEQMIYGGYGESTYKDLYKLLTEVED